MLIYLGKYLPITNETLNSLEFLQLRGDPAVLKQQMQLFNHKFQIINAEDLNSEFNTLASDGISKYWAGNNIFAMWDGIQNAGYEKLAMVARIAQTLPTSSSNVEQTFSEIKLLKPNLRNQLSDRSLEALLIINQELRIIKKFKVSNLLIRKKILQIKFAYKIFLCA